MNYQQEKNLPDNIPKIKVIVRKRPLNKKELDKGHKDIIEIENPCTLIVKEIKTSLDLTKYIDSHKFIFDSVYDENSTNETIYLETVRPLIESVFYNNTKITCFAFGQTGSGKTFTMMGSNIKKINNDNLYIPGFYVLASYDIFSFLKEKEFSNLTIYISFYEIYCSKLYDLLNNRNLLQIREDAKQNINIIGLTEKEVNDFDSLINLIQYGLKIRTIGITGLNNNSSRSHGIIEIKLMNKIKNKVHGKISFIDLAGSEREQDKININKKTRIDGAEINKSLLTLKECIRAMENNQKYFPFRGSKLTLVLRDSFIGNCKTLMIANISPSSFNADHTLNTLRYAYRVKELKKENKNKNYTKAKSDKKSACFNKDFIGGLLDKYNNKNNVSENNENLKEEVFYENTLEKKIENQGIFNLKENDNQIFQNIESENIHCKTMKKNTINKENLIDLEKKHSKIVDEINKIKSICVDELMCDIYEMGNSLNEEAKIIQKYKDRDINIKEYIKLMKKNLQSKIIKMNYMLINFDKFNAKINEEEELNSNLSKCNTINLFN